MCVCGGGGEGALKGSGIQSTVTPECAASSGRELKTLHTPHTLGGGHGRQHEGAPAKAAALPGIFEPKLQSADKESC